MNKCWVNLKSADKTGTARCVRLSSNKRKTLITCFKCRYIGISGGMTWPSSQIRTFSQRTDYVWNRSAIAMDGEKCSNSKWRHIKKPFRAKVIQTRKEFKFLNVPTQKKCAILACWKEFYLQKSCIILCCLPKRCFGLPEDRSLNCKKKNWIVFWEYMLP